MQSSFQTQNGRRTGGSSSHVAAEQEASAEAERRSKAEVEKASAGVRGAKREYIPDIEAFARYSYQENVPFLARNFGTFGVHFGYDLFDGGKKRATLRERDEQLAQAKENSARIRDEVEVRVQTAHNKLERTEQMVAVFSGTAGHPPRGATSLRTTVKRGQLSALASRRGCRSRARGPNTPAAIPTRIRSGTERTDQRDRINGTVIAFDYQYHALGSRGLRRR